MVSSCFPDFGFCPIKPVLFMSLVPVPVFVFFCLFFWGGLYLVYMLQFHGWP